MSLRRAAGTSVVGGVGKAAGRARHERTTRPVHVSLAMPAAGVLGVVAFGIGCFVAALAYRGTAGEAYSPLSHFISELGESGVSRLAPIFDLGVLLGGLGLVGFMIGLARMRGGSSGTVIGLTGAGAGIGGALVGVFPMNDLGTHTLVALVFFALSPVSVGLASAAILRRPSLHLPRPAGVVGLVSALVFAAFLVDAFSPLGMSATLPRPTERPAIWHLPILEWTALASLVIWVLATGLAWLRQGSEEAVR